MKAMVLLCLLTFPVVACDDPKGSGKPAAPASASVGDVDRQLAASKIKVPAQYQEQMRREINGDNVDEKVGALEDEILADAKKK